MVLFYLVDRSKRTGLVSMKSEADKRCRRVYYIVSD